MRNKIADYKVPKEVELMSDLPRTSSGKIDHLALKKREGAVEKMDALDTDNLINRIGRIDLELLRLLNERAKIVKQLKRRKPANSKLPLSPEREEEIILEIRGHNAGPLHDDVVEELFRKIIEDDIYL